MSDSTPMEGQTVPVNMYETDGAVVIVAPLAGVMPDDVDVNIDGSRLTLRAAMRTEATKDYLLHEWHYGPYERSLDIPSGFGPQFETSFGNGQLAIRVLRSS
jgi:HSP20 family molecular chaperone IbpA